MLAAEADEAATARHKADADKQEADEAKVKFNEGKTQVDLAGPKTHQAQLQCGDPMAIKRAIDETAAALVVLNNAMQEADNAKIHADECNQKATEAQFGAD